MARLLEERHLGVLLSAMSLLLALAAKAPEDYGTLHSHASLFLRVVCDGICWPIDRNKHPPPIHHRDLRPLRRGPPLAARADAPRGDGRLSILCHALPLAAGAPLLQICTLVLTYAFGCVYPPGHVAQSKLLTTTLGPPPQVKFLKLLQLYPPPADANQADRLTESLRKILTHTAVSLI